MVTKIEELENAAFYSLHKAMESDEIAPVP